MQQFRVRGRARFLSCATLAVISACAPGDGPTGPSVGTGADDEQMLRNPLASVSLFAYPGTRAEQTADAWRASRPADAREMDHIAAQPQARWFGSWSTDIRSDVDAAVRTAARAAGVPVLVAYNIPLRDCGSYSAGGAASADAYRRWISEFARGIGARRAIVILEPDALAGMDCLSSSQRSTRTQLIKYAIAQLKALAATSVYVDAGNSRWHTAATMAQRLSSAGMANADGFSLNVSNFFATGDEIAFGADVSSKTGGKHYVIDTSRNGLGPTADYQWCNPEGRALGALPTTRTGVPRVDAFLWIKVPGESDGACNGYPKAGAWVPEYALGLAQRAVDGTALVASTAD